MSEDRQAKSRFLTIPVSEAFLAKIDRRLDEVRSSEPHQKISRSFLVREMIEEGLRHAYRAA